MAKKVSKRMNDLNGSEWLKNSFTIWRDIRKTKEENKLKHPAMFPEMLAARLIECYTKKINDDKKRSVILDPFSGIGSTVIAALRLGRDSVGIELAKQFIATTKNRLKYVQTTLENSEIKSKPILINDRA